MFTSFDSFILSLFVVRSLLRETRSSRLSTIRRGTRNLCVSDLPEGRINGTQTLNLCVVSRKLRRTVKGLVSQLGRVVTIV